MSRRWANGTLVVVVVVVVVVVAVVVVGAEGCVAGGAVVVVGPAGAGVPFGCGGTALFLHPSTALTTGVGFTDAPPAGCTSKWVCGIGASPVIPTWPMIWPAVTAEPTDNPGANALRCA